MRGTPCVRKAFLGVAMTVVLAAGPALGAGGRWPMRRDGLDIIVETPHYRIRTDLGPEVGQTVATHQEALFRELYRRMGRIQPRKRVERLSVLVYESYRRYLAELGGDIAGSRGVFMPSKDVLACWARADELDLILETLRHEGTHQFVIHFIGRDCPIWLNEGLAVFYEHGQFIGGRLKIGQVAAARLRLLKKAMREGSLIPLSAMLTMTGRQWLYHVNSGSPEAGLQYAEAWSMVHFLAYAGKSRYQRAFLQYMYYVSRGEHSDTAWHKTFGTDVVGFQKHWEAYVKDLEPSADMACRMNLRLLGWILMRAAQGGRTVTDLKGFRQSVLEGKAGSWHMRTSDGFELSSDDRDRLERLFRCAQDDGPEGETSYELVPPGEDGVPGLRCTHHAGMVLETRVVRSAKGEPTDIRVSARPAGGRR